MPAPGASSTSNALKPGSHAGAAGVVADVYLSIKSKRAGPLLGESIAPGHLNEIIVHGWTWGVESTSDASSGLAVGRRRLQELVVYKTTDRSTTQLLNAINSNDSLKEVKLAMRKAGDSANDFLILALTDARVTSLQYTTDTAGEVLEVVHFGFQTMEMTTRAQLASGAAGPTMTCTIDSPAI